MINRRTYANLKTEKHAKFKENTSFVNNLFKTYVNKSYKCTRNIISPSIPQRNVKQNEYLNGTFYKG